MSVAIAPKNNFDIKLKQRSTSYEVTLNRDETSFDISFRPIDAPSNIVIWNLTNSYVDLGDYAMFIPSDSTKLITRDGMIFACEDYENLNGKAPVTIGANAEIYLAETIESNVAIGLAGAVKVTSAAVMFHGLRGKVGVEAVASASVSRPAMLSDYEHMALNEVEDMTLKEFYYIERS